MGMVASYAGRCLLTGLDPPVFHGGPVEDGRTLGLLVVSATADEEAVGLDNRQSHPPPHILDHHGVWSAPFVHK